jgi:hypothetical protein
MFISGRFYHLVPELKLVPDPFSSLFLIYSEPEAAREGAKAAMGKK